MVTRKDVAALAGVSVATVSNVFLGKVAVSKDAEAKVREAARYLKYVPNHTARSLSLGRSNHIGIAMNESTNPFHMEIIKYIEAYACMEGFLVTVFDMAGSLKNSTSFIERGNLDALINFTTVKFYDEFFDILQSQNTVMVNFGLDKGPSFGHEDADAMIECMKKLASFGHKSVGYISTLGRAILPLDERSRTFIEKRKEMGFSEDDDLIECDAGSAFKSSECGYKGMTALMKRHPELTAVFVMNDLAAIGAIRALKDMGYDCPKDVSVVGCDDIELSKLHIPSISTFGFDKARYGTKMAEKTIECILQKDRGIGFDFKVKSQAFFRESVSVCRNVSKR